MVCAASADDTNAQSCKLKQTCAGSFAIEPELFLSSLVPANEMALAAIHELYYNLSMTVHFTVKNG